MSTLRHRPLAPQDLASLPSGTIVTVRDGDRWAAFFGARADSGPLHFLPTVALRPSALVADARSAQTIEAVPAAPDFTVIDYEDRDGSLCRAVRLPTGSAASWFTAACGAEATDLRTMTDLLAVFDRSHYYHSAGTELGALAHADDSRI